MNKPLPWKYNNSKMKADKFTARASNLMRQPGRRAGQIAGMFKKRIAEASNATAQTVGRGVKGTIMTGDRGMHRLQMGLYKSETDALKPRHWAIRILIACVIFALLYFLMTGIEPFDGGFMLLICAFTVTMGAYFFFKGDVSMCGVDKAKLARPTAKNSLPTATNSRPIIENLT